MVWGPHPTIYVDQYRIYRKVESGAWEDIEDVDNDVFEYTDTEIYITPPGGQAGAKAYYYVKGVVWDPIEGETSSTNTVEVNLQTGQSEKKVSIMPT